MFLASETATNREVIVKRVVMTSNEERLPNEVKALEDCHSKYALSYSSIHLSNGELWVGRPSLK